MSEDKSLEENFETANARITPGVTIGGMGEVSLPNAENGNIGSGDVPDVADIDDDEEEAKKDKTKKKLEMEGFKLFTQFNNFITESLNEVSSNFKVLLKTAKDEPIGRKIRLGDKRSPGHEIWEKVDKMHWMNLKTEEKLDLNKWAKHADKFNMEGKDLQFENFMNEAFDDIADLVKSLHFETDPKIAKEKKIELGKRQGEVVPRTQIKGGEYSLRRFRKEIKYADGKDLGVFVPGTYTAAVSTLGDGPHKKAVKKVRWNQKMYDQWLEDVASNGGWEHAFDMAQNAKHERGLIDWVKKEFRGEDPMQRIQWDIEAFAESVVTEAKAYKLKASEFGADTHSAAYNVKGEPTWRVHSTYAIDQVSGENNPEERDVVFFEAMPINNDIYIKIGGINNLKRTNGATVGNNFGTTVEEWKKDPKGIAKEASEFLTDATHLKWINKKARSEGQVIKWALKDDYSNVIEDLVNKSLGLSESVTKDHFSEWYKLNEAKSVDRDEMMKWIKKSMDFVGTSEDFNGSQGGIHVSGEAHDEYKGAIIYSYYSEDYKNREFGVWNKWEKELNKRGWYSEWYDAGTVCIWPL